MVMKDMNTIKDYLFQLALVAIQIFVYHIFFAKKVKEKKKEKLVFSVLSGLSILLCMSFPTNSTSAVDIRIVPLLLGTLYGGMRTGLFLSAVIIMYRLCIGPVNLGFYNAMLTLLTSMPVILYFQKLFYRAQKSRRIQIAILLSIFYYVVGLTWFFILRGTFRILEVHIIHFIFTVAIVWFFISLNEIIKEINMKNQQLESEADRVQLLSNLTSVFAHEIRNPMQVTRGFLQLLNDPNLPDKKKEYIQYSVDELDRANGIINDLLSFGKPATNEITRIQVTSELSRVVNILQTHAMSYNVEIHTLLQADCWIHATPQKLHQVVINIVKNAIESMPNGGKVWLTCGPDNHGFIEISVKDQGIGMTQEQIEKMGSPYYSLKESGTGLGMMVTFQIIRNMQGKLKISSKKDVGTEFLIYLPQV
jgi:two-component system sporulation sensor kinase B